MSLADHLLPWSGRALRHIPAESPFDVLDFRYAGRGSSSRWNLPGQPTLYLAGDPGVVIAEWGRHFALDRTPDLQARTAARAVFTLDLTIDLVLDLRTPAVLAALSIDDAPACCLVREFARATAGFVRSTTAAQALLVPSVCFLDDLTRWCLVVFLDKLPPNRLTAITATPHPPLRWG